MSENFNGKDYGEYFRSLEKSLSPRAADLSRRLEKRILCGLKNQKA